MFTIVVILIPIIAVIGLVCNSISMNDELVRQQQEQQRLFMEQQRLFMEQGREQEQQFMDYSLSESLKSVTPFEHGGYDIHNGNSFNDFNSFGGGMGMF